MINLRECVKFFKSSMGLTIILLILLFGAALLINYLMDSSRHSVKKEEQKEIEDVEEDIFVVPGNTEKFEAKKDENRPPPKTKLELPPSMQEEENRIPALKPKEEKNKRPKYYRNSADRNRSGNRPPQQKMSMTLYDAQDDEEPTFVSDRFAPVGRFVQCKLINCLESGNLETPVVGMVMKDLWWENAQGEKKLIIPAGTEVKGSIKNSPVRNRLSGGKEWTFIFQKGSGMVGYELTLRGIAMEKSVDPENGLAAITDMTAGIPGRVLGSNEMAKMMSYVAAFMQGLSEGYIQENIYSTNSAVIYQNNDSNQNALAKGGQKLFGLILQEQLNKMAQETFFIRVPPGADFYVYVTEVIDLSKARIAGSYLLEQEEKQNNSGSRSNILKKYNIRRVK